LIEGHPERSLSWIEVRPFLKRLYHSWVCVLLMASSPYTSLTFQKSLKTFSIIWNKISHKYIAHENHPFLIAETFAEQARHVFTAINTAQRLNKLEWSSLWHSPKETHCYALRPAGPSPSCWCANSKVQKHYRLTSCVISIPWEYVVILHFQNLSPPIYCNKCRGK
jgi:hypothetical protein